MSYRRVVITAFGGPNVLRVVEEPVLPEPDRGEVRVRVLATGANFTDIMIRKGMYPGLPNPPFSPGYDLVGIVDAVGEDVSDLIVGQRVAALTVTGGCSELLCIPADRLLPVPGKLDPAEAVSLVLSYTTAYQMLHRVAGVEAGQRILVHGAGGAVGTALLQLGALSGLEMWGTDIRDKRELVQGLGARFIDYRSEDFVRRAREETEGGADAVFDPVGGEHMKRSLKALRRGGALVGFGFYNAVLRRQGGKPIPLDVMRLFFWNLLPNGRSARLYSIERWHDKHPDWFREDLSSLFELLSQGKIKPAIEKRMPMVEALHAHELMEQGNIQGRIVLVANQDWRGALSLSSGTAVPGPDA